MASRVPPGLPVTRPNGTPRHHLGSFAGTSLAELLGMPAKIPMALFLSSFDPGGTERQMIELMRRLDHDHIYAEALSTVSGVAGLEDRSPVRKHIWHDPAVAEQNHG